MAKKVTLFPTTRTTTTITTATELQLLQLHTTTTVTTTAAATNMTKNNMLAIIQTHITIIHNDADLIQNSIIIVTTTHATMLYQSISSIYKDSKHAVQFCLFPRMLRAGKIRKGLLEAEHQELTSGIGIAMHGQEKSKLIMDSAMMNQNHHIITHMTTIGFLECILPGGYS